MVKRVVYGWNTGENENSIDNAGKFLSPAWKEKEIQIKYDEHMGIYEF